VFPAKALADPLADTGVVATITVPLSGGVATGETGLRMRIFNGDAARLTTGERLRERVPLLDFGMTLKQTQPPEPEPPAGLSQQP
jgi:hypothetical protein